MRVGVEQRGSVAVLRPSGDMDATALPLFEQKLEELIAAGVKGVLWDLADVRLLPSSAIGLLLASARRLRERGGRMAVARAGRLVRSTLRTMGILDVFPIHPDVEEGVRSLGGD
jgi:anti-anti-sigma factor